MMARSRIEWLSLKGTTEVDDRSAVTMSRLSMSRAAAGEDSLYVITIRLRTGKKIRSPVLVGKDQTRAVQAEIIRRLGLNRWGAG